MKKVVLLGSTGSVGKSSLEVIEKNKEKYEVVCLVALSNVELIKAQSKRHKKEKYWSRAFSKAIEKMQIYCCWYQAD